MNYKFMRVWCGFFLAFGGYIAGALFFVVTHADTNVTLKAGVDARMFFVGDIMLDRNVRRFIDREGAGVLFENVSELFEGNDAVIANLEGPFTENKSVATSEHLVFTFDPRDAPALREAGITHVSLANNHTANFGAKGMARTREVLNDADIAFFGSPDNNKHLSYFETINSARVGFIGYHQFSYGIERVIKEIKRVRTQADMIFVIPHWGNEYAAHAPSSAQVALAHQFIDAGADMVIGHHAHVVQPFEIYKNKFIAYSLGNFIFDQRFSEDVKTELGLGVRVTATAFELTLHPLYRQEFQVALGSEKQRAILLTRLAKESKVSAEKKKEILLGKVVVAR